MGQAYYLRPDKMLTFRLEADGSITPATVTGAVDTGYEADWLCDGRAEYPFASPPGDNLAAGIAGFSTSCGLAVLHSHLCDAAVTAEITGDLTVSLEDRGGDRPNRIPWNRWAAFEPTVAANLTLTVDYNTRDNVIGELLVGQRFSIDPPQPGVGHELPIFGIPKNAEFATGNGYDKGLAGGRLVKCAQAFTREELDAAADGLIAWVESCRNGTLPTAFVPNSDRDDVLVGTLLGFGWEDQDGFSIVTLTFQEYTRQRWRP